MDFTWTTLPSKLSSPGWRPHGRPKKLWMNIIRQNKEKIEIAPEDALDRPSWKRRCANPDPGKFGDERGNDYPSSSITIFLVCLPVWSSDCHHFDPMPPTPWKGAPWEGKYSWFHGMGFSYGYEKCSRGRNYVTPKNTFLSTSKISLRMMLDEN